MLAKNPKEVIKYAYENGIVMTAFNTINLETTLAIVEAYEDSGYPGIIQIAPTNITLSSYEFISQMTHEASKDKFQSLLLHLDHGRTLEDVKSAVEAGFNSVMIDASDQCFEDNIKIVQKVVNYCKPLNVLVEAELGAISGKEDDNVVENESVTDVSLVKEFVERTGCDLLAVSVGNVHGLELEPNINFELLKEIHEVSPVPLVIHGGSGIPTEDVQRLGEYGVVKINVASDLRKMYIRTIGEAYAKNNDEYNLIGILLETKDNMKMLVKNKVGEMNGSKGL